MQPLHRENWGSRCANSSLIKPDRFYVWFGSEFLHIKQVTVQPGVFYFFFPPPPLQSIVIHFPQTKMLGYGQTNQTNLHKHNMQMTICKCQMENPELKPGSNKTMLKKLC